MVLNINSPGKELSSQLEVWLLLNAYHLGNVVKLKIPSRGLYLD